VIVYKLTSQKMRTHGGFQWELGVPRVAEGEWWGLCSAGCLHFYYHPILAALMNPAHARLKNPRLFEAKASCYKANDYHLKGGCRRLTLLRELELPRLSLLQRLKIAMRCVRPVVRGDEDAKAWIDGWLEHRDRGGFSVHNTADFTYLPGFSMLTHAVSIGVIRKETRRGVRAAALAIEKAITHLERPGLVLKAAKAEVPNWVEPRVKGG
jgi:hypothetical protein